jgi:hypothetical protein
MLISRQKGKVARSGLQAYNQMRKADITNLFIKMFKQKILSYFGNRALSLFSDKNDPFVELSARLLAFSVGGSVRSISWGLICVSFQLASITHFSIQLLQGNAVFLQEVDQHLRMT